MSEFRIFTDGACDLPQEWCREHRVTVLPMYYHLASDTAAEPYPGGRAFPFGEFYRLLGEGVSAKTAASGVEECAALMRPVLAEGMDVIYLGLSSKLSGMFNSVRLAAIDLQEEFPERRIAVLDSGCASLGLGLLVRHLAELREKGTALPETKEQITALRTRVRHFFTVSDLMYLKRGGRIGGGTAVMGTMLQIMPLMQMMPGGGIESIGKVRGRKNALRQLADTVGEAAAPGTPAAVGHCAAPEDAQLVRDILRRKFGIADVWLLDIGPVIGTHGGPGTVAGFCIS